MKKNGFALVETLIATTLVATVFTVLYVQFMNINENYRKTYENNTVEGLYASNNIKNYLLSNNYEDLAITSYINMDCDMFTNKTQCNNLLSVLDIKNVYIMIDDITSIREDIYNDSNISDGLKKFVKSVNTTTNPGYRLLVEFNNDTYATIKVG